MSSRLSFANRRWLWTLVGGVVLFAAVERGFKATGNLYFVPTLLLVGAFTVPVTFVAYFSERERMLDRDIHQEVPLQLLAICFIVGGVLGTLAAGLAEFQAFQRFSVRGTLSVGVIEETAKLILPIMLFIRSRYHSDADGLLFGVASGMGFAALETMGYGLVSVMRSRGDVDILQELLLVRGLISPAGHAAWTGLICSVLWRERNRVGRPVLNLAVVGAFVWAVVLHSLWNSFAIVGARTPADPTPSLLGNLAVAAVSLTLLLRRLRGSSKQERLKAAPKAD